MVSHSRYVIFQMAEVAVPRILFREILDRIRQLRFLTIPRKIALKCSPNFGTKKGLDSMCNKLIYCNGLNIEAPVAQLDRASVYGTEDRVL